MLAFAHTAIPFSEDVGFASYLTSKGFEFRLFEILCDCRFTEFLGFVNLEGFAIRQPRHNVHVAFFLCIL
jgi:hypothetical protein